MPLKAVFLYYQLQRVEMVPPTVTHPNTDRTRHCLALLIIQILPLN
jgi:hypothetical protein